MRRGAPREVVLAHLRCRAFAAVDACCIVLDAPLKARRVVPVGPFAYEWGLRTARRLERSGFWSNEPTLRNCRADGVDPWSSGPTLRSRHSNGAGRWSNLASLRACRSDGTGAWSSGSTLRPFPQGGACPRGAVCSSEPDIRMFMQRTGRGALRRGNSRIQKAAKTLVLTSDPSFR